MQLRTNARYFHQYGTFNRKQLNASGRGLWSPSDNFSAQLSHQYNEQIGGGRGSDLPLSRTNASVIGVQHALYGSLTSRARVNLLQESRFASPGNGGQQIGSRQRESLAARLAYQRHLAWGRIFIGYGDTRGREDHQAENTTHNIANESHQLDDGNEPRLHESNVDIGGHAGRLRRDRFYHQR